MKKPIVLAFGRMNPPTKGHLKLVNKMAEVARKYDCPAELYLSHSQDQLRNPLSYDSKVYWVDKAFGNKVDVVESEARTVFEILKDLYSEGYTDVIYVGGADRIGGAEDISKTILKYNGTENKNGEIPYYFDSIKFVNAGVRDDSSNDISERASASAARAAVVNGNFEGFKQLVPFNESDADNLFRQIYAIMVDEELPESLYDFIKGTTLSEGLLLEGNNFIGNISVNGETFNITKDNHIICGERRHTGDFKNIFLNGNEKRPIEVNIPQLQSSDYTNYEVDGYPDNHGRLVIKYENNGREKTATYKATKGNVIGQSAGEFTEALVCYYYNNGLSALDNEPLPEYNGDKIDLDPYWRSSIIKTVKILMSKWSPSRYTAIQVNGKVLDPENISDDISKISEIYRSKKLASKNLGLNLNDLYDRFKDDWNKGDILLVRKDITFQEIQNLINNSGDLTDLVSKYNVGKSDINDGRIISISLKKISPNVNTVDYVVPKDEEDTIKWRVILQMPFNRLKDDYSATCYLKSIDETGHEYKIQFRSRTAADPGASIEVMYALARGGKPINRVKNKLKLKENFYDNVVIESPEELWDALSKRFGPKNIVGFDSFSAKMSNPAYEKFDVKWYNRTCFRSLIALYDRYVDYIKEKYDNNGKTFDLSQEKLAQKFMSLIYNIATTTPSTFWLIK